MTTEIPVLFVPGHLCDHRIFAPQIDALCTHPHSVAEIGEARTIADMAERMLESAPERFVIMGLSMGGMIAMEALVRAPERIAAAILLDTDPNAARPRETAFRDEMREGVAREGIGFFAERFAPRFYGHSEAATARLLAPTRAMMDEASVERFMREADALDTRRDMLDLLRDCSVPCEIAVGSEDVICPPKLHDALADALPRARLTMIAGAGHITSLEAPDDVTQILRHALRQPT